MDTPELDLATPGDADWVTDLIAKAFHPLDPCAWLVPDPAARARILPRYFRIFVEHALGHGAVHISADASSAAVWLPVGANGPTDPVGYRDRLADAVGSHLERFEQFDEQLDKAHPAGIAHHHLWLLAVHPNRQHAGLGSALLTAYHQRLDREGTPAYLEASDAGTRQFYLRHGYADHRSPIELPGGPLMHPMIRAPRPEQPSRDGSEAGL